MALQVAGRARSTGGLPPGPRSALLASWGYARRPYQIHERLRQRFGDPFTLPTLAGTMVVTGDPAGVKELFASAPDRFEPAIPDNLREFVPPNSIQLLKGERHLCERRLLAPFFHGSRMRAYGELMVEIAHRHFSQVPRGARFSMLELCQRISLDSILGAVFGIRDPVEAGVYRDAVLEFASSIRPSILFFGALRRDLFGRGPWTRYQTAKSRMDDLLYAVIRRRRSEPVGDDILAQMLAGRRDDGGQLSDEEVRDELVTLLFAGHETTATALAWSYLWLHKQPEFLVRLKSELSGLSEADQLERCNELPFLDGLCYESLRVNPIPADITRRLARDDEFLGYVLPAGTLIAASPYLVHTNPQIYAEPHAFRPERFIKKRFAPHEFLPFGGGTHRCLGAALALYEMKVVLASTVGRYDVSLAGASDAEAVRHTITMGPRHEVAMILRGSERAS